MPYKIEKSSRCGSSKPWAVMKTDGKLMGCHETEEDAKDQLTALNISESMKAVSDIDFTPPEAVRKAAARGLALRKQYKRGGTLVGVARARDLSNGKAMSPSTIMRMVSFFARHEVNKKAKGFYPGSEGYPSPGRIAWLLWGGDAGKRWANKIARQLKARETSKDMSTKSYGTGYLLSKSSYFDSYKKPESEALYVKGFASVEIEDRQGHIVDPLEFNVDTFINTGTLLRDHKYISDAFGNHVSAGKVIGAEPAEIYKADMREDGQYFAIKSVRTGDHITDLPAEKHPELSVGDKGLFVVAEVTNELAKAEVESGILNAFSWRGWNYQVNEGDRIRLKSVDLSEISLVHQPVNHQSTYVMIKGSDAKMLADNLRVTKLRFRSNSFKSVDAVNDYLKARNIDPVTIKETEYGFVAVLDHQDKYETAKSVCIAGGDCELIAAPVKDQNQDSNNFVATVAGEEPETLTGENGMSQDSEASQDRQSLRFCVVDEAILQKLFPNSARTELVKSATLALEDGEVADVEILEATISDEEIAALLKEATEAEAPEATETEPEASAEATETVVEEPAQAPANIHEDIVALIKATADRQAAVDAKLAELLKKDEDVKQVSEMDKLRQELEAAKAELAQYIPPQDEREERSESTKGTQTEASVGNMFSFLFK